MFFPIGDTPNPKNFIPYVNWAIIAVNAAAYLFITLPLSNQSVDPNDPALREYLTLLYPTLHSWLGLRELLSQTSAYDLFVFAHGYRPGSPQFFDLMSSMFLHANFLHLAGNMFFLWIFGDNVEHRLGRIGYVLTYLVTGILATLSFSLLAGSSQLPLVGASGAISGILGIYFLLFPRNRVKVFALLFPFFMDVLLLPARWVLGFYVLIDNLLPLLIGAASNVAYGAHLGGFVGGLAIAGVGEHLAWRWPRRVRGGSFFRFPRRAGKSTQGDPLGVIRDSLAQGDRTQALSQIPKLDRQQLTALQPEECVVLADWLTQTGNQVVATRLLRRCLAAHPGSQNLARVYLALGLSRLEQGQPTAAYQHLLSVFDFQPDPQTAALAQQALARINVYRQRG